MVIHNIKGEQYEKWTFRPTTNTNRFSGRKNQTEKLEKLKRDVAILYNLGISKKTLDRWICKYYKL